MIYASGAGLSGWCRLIIELRVCFNSNAWSSSFLIWCLISIWPFLHRAIVLQFHPDYSIFKTFRWLPLHEQWKSFFLVGLTVTCPSLPTRPNSWQSPGSTMLRFASGPLHDCSLSLNALLAPLSSVKFLVLSQDPDRWSILWCDMVVT